MRCRVGALLGGLALVLAACAGSQASTGPAAQPSLATGAPVASYSPVPGNSATAAVPTDVPAAVMSRPPLPSCGAEILFEVDPDESPADTPPAPTTDAAANAQAVACLSSAWDNGAAAELVTSEISDEGDQIYTLYRLPGDGTLQLITRVWSHTELSAQWTTETCRQMSVQEGTVTPADCTSEVPVG